MSISNALNNAALGLGVAGRLADTISQNVANAMTPGFGRRTTELSSMVIGGYGSGVRVAGYTRAENPFLTAERRGLDAALGATGTRSDVHDRLMAAMGEPGAANSVTTRATALETALMGATASPQSGAKLSAAVEAARALAVSIRGVADETVRLRTEADAEINRQVGQVNAALGEIDELNKKIVLMNAAGADITGLQDERARVINSISSIIPLRAVKRDHDQIALYSQNGGVLLDGRVYELRFTPGPSVVTADMTLGAPLSPLQQDQLTPGGPVTLAAGTGTGMMDGGSLGALFEVRDRVVPEFGADLDLYAEDLIGRFRDLMPPAALDGAGDGLIVDTAPGALTGLAGRIGINAAVDPTVGGATWRLRDGLAAAAPGDQGFGDWLQALSDAMIEPRTPVGFVSQNADAGSAGMAAEIGSFFAGRAARSDEDRAFLTGRQSVLAEQEMHTTGVDTDAELQSLMLVEQTYAANARVLSVIDELMKLLLES